MADKLNAALHPYVYACTDCGARYVTPSAAETCADQDADEDRATRSVYRRSK